MVPLFLCVLVNLFFGPRRGAGGRGKRPDGALLVLGSSDPARLTKPLCRGHLDPALWETLTLTLVTKEGHLVPLDRILSIAFFAKTISGVLCPDHQTACQSGQTDSLGFPLGGRPRRAGAGDAAGSRAAWSTGFITSIVPSTSSRRITAAPGTRCPVTQLRNVVTGAPR